MRLTCFPKHSVWLQALRQAGKFTREQEEDLGLNLSPAHGFSILVHSVARPNCATDCHTRRAHLRGRTALDSDKSRKRFRNQV
jgi:hypothetical protein